MVHVIIFEVTEKNSLSSRFCEKFIKTNSRFDTHRTVHIIVFDSCKIHTRLLHCYCFLNLMLRQYSDTAEIVKTLEKSENENLSYFRDISGFYSPKYTSLSLIDYLSWCGFCLDLLYRL